MAISQLWRFVEGVQGKEEWYTDKQIITGVLNQLPLKDMHIILNAVKAEGYGIDPRVTLDCTNCQQSSPIEVPIDENFFSVN